MFIQNCDVKKEKEMKIIVYLVVFCLLFFLLVLSFDEGKNTSSTSEWNQVATEFETEISNNNHTPIDSGTRMNEQNQIVMAQEEGITGLSLATASLKALFDKLGNNVSDIMSAIGAKTKESAYTLASDISELLYPTKKSKKAETSSIMSTKQAHAMSTPIQQNQEPIQPATSDKSIPVPNTMADKNSPNNMKQ